jgi:hypothetical protein
MAKLDPKGATKSDDGDDSITSARTIALGESIKAEILPFTDADYYKVTISPDVARSLRVILRKSNVVTEVVIYDQNENVIERKFDMSNPTLSFSLQRPSGSHFYISVASQGLPSVYSLTPQQGTYELLVRAE